MKPNSKPRTIDKTKEKWLRMVAFQKTGMSFTLYVPIVPSYSKEDTYITKDNEIAICFDQDKKGVLLDFTHEIIHSALDHIRRGVGRIKFIWSIAIDHVVNSLMIQLGITDEKELAKYNFLLLSDEFSKGPCEVVYRELLHKLQEMAKEKQRNKGQSKEDGEKSDQGKSDQGKSDQGKSDHGSTDPGTEQLLDQMIQSETMNEDYTKYTINTNSNESKEIFSSSTIQGSSPSTTTPNDLSTQKPISGSSMAREELLKTIGSIPGDMKREFNIHNSCKGIIELVTRKSLSLLGQERYGYTYCKIPCHSRAIYRKKGIRLPGTLKKYTEAAFAIDSSGSISSTELSYFMGALKKIQPVCDNMYGWVIDCAIHAFYENPTIPFEVKGGGGTDFRPVFEDIARRKLNPKLLLFFTDLMGVFPDKIPPYPVIWVIVRGVGQTKLPSVPFGTLYTL
jgi:predicted metal-dependent peptidase